MEKHEDNLDKLLKAELEKEAGEIMEEMDSDESLQDISFPEDLDEKMWSKIHIFSYYHNNGFKRRVLQSKGMQHKTF